MRADPIKLRGSSWCSGAHRSARNLSRWARPDPAALAWGVFWWMKHMRASSGSTKAPCILIGDRDQQDLLDRARRARCAWRDPSEDCDGFTMLTGGAADMPRCACADRDSCNGGG